MSGIYLCLYISSGLRCFVLIKHVLVHFKVFRAAPKYFGPAWAQLYSWQPLQGLDINYLFIHVWSLPLSAYFLLFEVFQSIPRYLYWPWGSLAPSRPSFMPSSLDKGWAWTIYLLKSGTYLCLYISSGWGVLFCQKVFWSIARYLGWLQSVLALYGPGYMPSSLVQWPDMMQYGTIGNIK
jgi:hypothetical protein